MNLEKQIVKILTDEWGETTRQAFDDAVNRLTALFAEVLNEAIGGDEHTKPVRGMTAALSELGYALRKSTRNELRAEIKSNLKKAGIKLEKAGV